MTKRDRKPMCWTSTVGLRTAWKQASIPEGAQLHPEESCCLGIPYLAQEYLPAMRSVRGRNASLLSKKGLIYSSRSMFYFFPVQLKEERMIPPSTTWSREVHTSYLGWLLGNLLRCLLRGCCAHPKSCCTGGWFFGDACHFVFSFAQLLLLTECRSVGAHECLSQHSFGTLVVNLQWEVREFVYLGGQQPVPVYPRFL